MTTIDRQPATGIRREVSLREVIVAAWFQHRRPLLATGAVVVVLAAVIVAASLTGPSASTVGRLVGIVDLYAVLIGVFQGAPLIAREYEHGTYRWAWTQDVSPTRWLAGTMTLFVGFAVVSALLLGCAGQQLVAHAPDTHSRAFETGYFDSSPLVQVGHVVFALALGVTLGLLLRRSVPAMILSLLAFLLSWAGVTAFWRPHYLTPLRQVVPIGEQGGLSYGDPQVGLLVSGGLVDGRGAPTPFPTVCRGTPEWRACLTRNGITGTYLDYQPMDRLGAFHLLELGLFLAAALVLGALAWVTLRRRTRIPRYITARCEAARR